MKILPFLSFVLFAVALTCAAAPAFAQEAPVKKKIAITKIAATEALNARMARQGVGLSLDSVLQALDSQVYDQVLNTGRFDVLERSDADALAKESAAAGHTFQVNQADYLLTIRVDSFNDRIETRRFAALGKTVSARVIELSAVAKITDVATQRAIVSTNFQVTQHEADTLSENTIRKVGEASDALLIAATREMAQKIARRVADAVYPARIIGRRDKMVTINRNDRSGIAPGQIWEIFASGEDLVDPDTGEKTKEEVYVGKVKVTRVTPQNAQAEIVEDSGIDRGAYARRQDDAPAEDAATR